MSKRRVAQKIISFESKKKGMIEIDKELLEGWRVVSIVPHKDGYLCVLERLVVGANDEPDTNTIQDILSMMKVSRTRKKLLQDA